MIRTAYFYKYNEVTTTIKPKTPSWELFNQWWEEFNSNVNLEDYSVYIGGKFIIDPSTTKDIDIILTGPIYDYENLYNIFKYGLDLSLNKYGIFVDLCWWDNIDFFKYPKRKDFIRYHNTIKMSGIEYLILSDICVYDINHTTFDENLEVPEYLAFNRVILPMDKQMNEKYNTPPIKLR